MKIIRKNLKEGKIRIYVDNMEDLWYLHNVIEPDDVVYGLSYRSKEVKGDRLREKKPEKITMWVGIMVETIEFHPFSNLLRVHGVIVRAPQDIGLYHTLTIEPGVEVVIEKEKWERYELDTLREGEKASKKARIIFVSIDDEEATIALMRSYGIEKIAGIGSGKSGKQYKKSPWMKEFFGKIESEIRRQMGDSKKELVIVGPGFVKDHFVSFLNGKYEAIVESVSQEGLTGIKEAIKRGVVKRVESDIRVVEEYQKIEKLLSLMAKGSGCAIGETEVKKALDLGAAEEFFIINKLIHKNEAVIKKAYEKNCKVTIISAEHDGGKILKNLGGMAAMLRFNF